MERDKDGTHNEKDSPGEDGENRRVLSLIIYLSV